MILVFDLYESPLLSGMHQIQAHLGLQFVHSTDILWGCVQVEKIGQNCSRIGGTQLYTILHRFTKWPPNQCWYSQRFLVTSIFRNYKAHYCKTDLSVHLLSTAIWRPQPAPLRQASLSRCASNDANTCGAADRQPFLYRWNTTLPQREAPDVRDLGFYKCALIK